MQALHNWLGVALILYPPKPLQSSALRVGLLLCLIYTIPGACAPATNESESTKGFPRSQVSLCNLPHCLYKCFLTDATPIPSARWPIAPQDFGRPLFCELFDGYKYGKLSCCRYRGMSIVRYSGENQVQNGLGLLNKHHFEFVNIYIYFIAVLACK